MKLGVLGTGMVGTAIATKLVALGHEVLLGSRDAANEKAAGWAAEAGEGASHGTFGDAAHFGEILVNATAGGASIAALSSAAPADLAGKVLIDVANALDHSHGFPPALSVVNTDSLAEQIQRTFPDLKVVKTLNTVSADIMVDPSLVPGSHNVFVSGNDGEAKRQVVDLLASFGWPREDVIDLGDITTARGPEMYLGLWLRTWGALGVRHFNVKVVKA